MEILLNDLSLDKDIKDALLGYDNDIRELMLLCEALEIGDFDIVERYSKLVDIEDRIVYDVWLNYLNI